MCEVLCVKGGAVFMYISDKMKYSEHDLSNLTKLLLLILKFSGLLLNLNFKEISLQLTYIDHHKVISNHS